MSCILPAPEEPGNKGDQGKTDGDVEMGHAEHEIGNNDSDQNSVFAHQEILKGSLKTAPGDEFLNRGKHRIGQTSED